MVESLRGAGRALRLKSESNSQLSTRYSQLFPSFVPQCLDRIQARGASRRHEAEKNADGRREDKGNHVDFRIEEEGRTDHLREAHAETVGERDPTEAAHAGKRHCFHQELQHHLPRPRADGHADTDLAGALGHGNEHDVHDADAADEQAYPGHGTQQRGHHLRAGAHRIRDLAGG